MPLKEAMRMRRFVRAVTKKRHLEFLLGLLGKKNDIYVCVHTFKNVFGVLRKRWENLKKSLVLSGSGTMVHALRGRSSNRLNYSDTRDIIESVKLYIGNLEKEFGEMHATRFVRILLGLQARNNKKVTYLPSSMTVHDLYQKWAFTRGYIIKADTKGRYGKFCDYAVSEEDDTFWQFK